MRLLNQSATDSLGYRNHWAIGITGLSDRPELLEPGPQPYCLITVAELPPLGALSLPGDPLATPRQARIALSRGDRK
jgi:hypothetical protein